jgi:hypothetical protein
MAHKPREKPPENRGPGRPRLGREPAPKVSVPLSAELLARIARAAQPGESRAATIRRLLERALA